MWKGTFDVKNIEKAIMATVIQPSVWDLWWKIAIYHDNAKWWKKEPTSPVDAGSFAWRQKNGKNIYLEKIGYSFGRNPVDVLSIIYVDSWHGFDRIPQDMGNKINVAGLG